MSCGSGRIFQKDHCSSDPNAHVSLALTSHITNPASAQTDNKTTVFVPVSMNMVG